MKIKICGIFRDVDLEFINEARPDYTGFVFTSSRREISLAQAVRFKQHLAEGIETVGVFVNIPTWDIAALYRDGIVSLAQLHGNEDDAYIARLKENSLKHKSVPIPVIKTIKNEQLERTLENPTLREDIPSNADYYLIDSGAGSGKAFNWDILKTGQCVSLLNSLNKPWFLAGGIATDNIAEAMSLNPFCLDVSSGAEDNGVKDREKILQLTKAVREGIIS